MAQTSRARICVIGFYNLENLYDTIDHPSVNDEEFTPKGKRHYGTAIFRDKLGKLATVIAGMGTEYSSRGPVLLGVAELENDTVLQYLVQHPLIRERNYHIVHAPSKDARGIDVAMLYQPDQFFPLGADKLYVPLPGASKDAYHTRDILYVKGLLQQDTVHIYVNHWPSRRGGKKRSEQARMKAAGVCRRHMDSLLRESPGAKLILMGDLNDDPTDRSIREVLKSHGNKALVAANELYNPWVQFYERGIGTLAHNDAWGLFDQILLSRSWLHAHKTGLRLYSAHIYDQPFMRETTGRYRGYPMRTWDGFRYRGGYSDHFPVYLVLMDTGY
jgi:hypothetical protein